MKYLLILGLLSGCCGENPTDLDNRIKYESLKLDSSILVISGFYEGCYGEVVEPEPYSYFKVNLGGSCGNKSASIRFNRMMLLK